MVLLINMTENNILLSKAPGLGDIDEKEFETFVQNLKSIKLH